MKKFLAMALAAVMVLGVAGCGMFRESGKPGKMKKQRKILKTQNRQAKQQKVQTA